VLFLDAISAGHAQMGHWIDCLIELSFYIPLNTKYTVCQKRPTYTACYNFVTHEQILIFLAETLPIKWAIKRYFNMLVQITCASALPGKTVKHENHIFTQMLY